MRLQGLCIIFVFFAFALNEANSTSRDDTTPIVARLIDRVEPQYSPKMRVSCINVDVELKLKLDRRGEVKSATVISCSTPKMGFEKSATEAAKKSVFVPLYFLSENPPKTQAVRCIVKFRCYNGLIATKVRDSATGGALFQEDSLPSEIRNLTFANWSNPRLLTLYPLDSSTASSVNESDIWLKFRLDAFGRVFKPSVTFSTTSDTMYTNLALQVLNEGNFFEELPWVKQPDSQYIRIAFRKHKPIPAKSEYDSSFVPPDTLAPYRPDYPSHALELNNTGGIKVLALLDKDGSVLQATFQRSSGYYSLDYAAVQSVYRSKFKPAMMNDTTIQMWVTYLVKFDTY